MDVKKHCDCYGPHHCYGGSAETHCVRKVPEERLRKFEQMLAEIVYDLNTNGLKHEAAQACQQ